LAETDSFLELGKSGWPEHRASRPDSSKFSTTPGCAHFRGSRKRISVETNDRAALIFMDCPNRCRLKICAHAKLRDLVEFYYWTRKLQAHFFRRDHCFGGARLAARVPLLWTPNTSPSSDDR
jgi:hypothetical protein